MPRDPPAATPVSPSSFDFLHRRYPWGDLLDQFVAPHGPVRETLAKYAGAYTASERDAAITGMEVTITLEQDQLVLMQASGERSPLIAQSETSFFFQRASTEVDFVLDEKGAVSHMLVYVGGPPIKMARK